MSRNNTGNPIDSKAYADFEDNVKNMDLAMNSDELRWSDRFGRDRKSFEGMEREFDSAQHSREARFNDFIASSGYQFLGDYGPDIEFTEYNQLVRDANGEFWRLSGQVELPYTTTGSGIPEDDALVPAGDAVLRQDLANPDKGAGMVAYNEFLSVKRRLSASFYADDFGAVGDGLTDDTDAINNALAVVSGAGGGTLYLSSGKTYIAENILPKPNVLIEGQRAKIKLKPNATNPLFYYNNSDRLYRFSLSNIVLDGNNIAQDIIHITEPSPAAPKKTWEDSIIFNCRIHRSGGRGIYVPIPGRVRLIGGFIEGNDIGIAFDREHLDIYNTQIQKNRIGAVTTGNHFCWMHASFAHNTEKAVTTMGASGSATDIFEAAIIGCTFIDNRMNSIEGELNQCRIIGNRFLTADKHISEAYRCIISGNQFKGWDEWAIDGVSQLTNINGNIFLSGSGYANSNGVRIKASGSRSAYQPSILGNVFRSISGVCVEVSGVATSPSIKNNTFSQCENGILISDGVIDCIVTGNIFRACSGVAIDLAPANNMTLTGNVIQRNGLQGIIIRAGSPILCLKLSDNSLINTNENSAGNAIEILANLHSSSVSNNLFRGETGTLMQSAIHAGSPGAGANNLFMGNIARNMQGDFDFVLTSGFEAIGNKGTISN